MIRLIFVQNLSQFGCAFNKMLGKVYLLPTFPSKCCFICFWGHTFAVLMPFSALQWEEMFAERPFCLFTPGPGNSVQTAYTDFDCPCSALDNRSRAMSYILFYFLLVNSGQFMQFHVTCCLQTRLLTNSMARKSITYWHCCCKPRPLFMRLVNLTYQLLHYIFERDFSSDVFSVWDTGRCNTFFRGRCYEDDHIR